MADIAAPTLEESSLASNVADRLTRFAATMPNAIAVACPHQPSPRYRRRKQGDSGTTYAITTFAELDADATAIARGLAAWGVPSGTRLALLVRPGIEFITLVFALLRAGMVIILVDPGLGRRHLLRCLCDAEPEGFVAISIAQAARVCYRRRFPRSRWNVTVGRRWFWGGLTLGELRAIGQNTLLAPCSSLLTTLADTPAAIIFTSGSTGPPKGVLYTHRMFDTQVAEIQSTYGIEPGGIDLACFPLFALFNAAMGVTTVLPEMDFSRPASANPEKLLAAANDWRVTQAFASPAVWRIISNHCAKTGDRIPTLRQVFSCGAPVPASVLRTTLACVAPDAKMHTPYGATECLPIATIDAAEVLSETAVQTNAGAGVCVGRKFESIDWRVIRITDDPIESINDAEELPPGEIGELVVLGPQASPRYVTRTEVNAQSKIDPQSAIRNPQSEVIPWHRTGDVGYLDDAGRFWYCGRKSHRVETTSGTLFTEPVEAIFNVHRILSRTALVGIGERGKQIPVVVYEPRPIRALYPGGRCNSPEFYESIADDLRELATKHTMTRDIRNFLRHPSLPVDVRHNAKINREQLAVWAAQQLPHVPSQPPTSRP